MAKKKKGKGYLNGGNSKLVNIILWIFFGWILGVITRFLRGNILGGVLCIIFDILFIWVDLITIILHNDITFFA